MRSVKKSALKKGVRFETADEEDDDEEVHVTLPKTPYSGAKRGKAALDTPAAMRSISAKAEMELAMLYEGMDGKKEGCSSVKGKLHFE